MSSFPFPLGATPTPSGVNFAVAAPHAQRIWIAIRKDTDWNEYELIEKTSGIWHGIIPQAHIGDYYGIRADGPWSPYQGWYFNRHKLLLDPYARQITGHIGHYFHLLPYEDDPFSQMNTTDSANDTICGVISELQPQCKTSPLLAPWNTTIIYEAHISSLTAEHPKVPPQLQGTYRGAAHPAIIDHLLSLGITAIEFLPIHACVTEPTLQLRNMRNHWGYSTAAFFAPDPRYASEPGQEIIECADMIDTFHKNGIEVILDVVYNHSCESDIFGPSISWRGLGAKDYYLIDDSGQLINYTGCGNTFNATSPLVIQMVMDSLRYWANNFAIDGFRFDLTPILGRGSLPTNPDNGSDFWAHAPLLAAIGADPVLCMRKLIAEPWDATTQGYSLGKFSAQWSEWNDNFRDTSRKFWIHQTPASQLSTRIAGSADLFNNRSPQASINFITAHDGFTLCDLVSYNHKHNDVNGENNQDGSNNNYSINYGIEGPAQDESIRLSRSLHQRNLLATLFLSAGIPMLLAGDEIGHSNSGNNNAYCEPKNPDIITSFALKWSDANEDLLSYTKYLISIRSLTPSLCSTEFYSGKELHPHADLLWFDANGNLLEDHMWANSPHTMQAYFRSMDDHTLIVYNNTAYTQITLPTPNTADTFWKLIFTSISSDGRPKHEETIFHTESKIDLIQPCVLVFQAD